MINSEFNEIHKNLIRHYIRAKDDNKPHLMKSAFTDSATLEMKVKTDKVSFPSKSVGREIITDVLVRNFSQTYENVYTFCVADSMHSQENTMSCRWLVAMTERDSGNARVGFGVYDWSFVNNETILANQLIITIEQMLVLTPEYSSQITEWIGQASYPFCNSEKLIESMPDLEQLKLVREFISQDS